MKLTLGAILFSALALFLFIVSSPPYEFNNFLLRFTVIFSIIAILLSVCLLPWFKRRFSEKWALCLRLAVFVSMFSYVLGYLTFALSTLI